MGCASVVCLTWGGSTKTLLISHYCVLWVWFALLGGLSPPGLTCLANGVSSTVVDHDFATHLRCTTPTSVPPRCHSPLTQWCRFGLEWIMNISTGWDWCVDETRMCRVLSDVKFRSSDLRQTLCLNGICNSYARQRSCQLFAGSGLSAKYAKWRNVRRRTVKWKTDERETKGGKLGRLLDPPAWI